MASTKARRVGWFVVVVLAVYAAYANHFHNDFQFDDQQTVVANAYIRDLKHLPLLFTDARTSTPNPSNQIYRPLVTVSLAIDYALGGGLVPFWFHLSTFLWYLVQLAVMYVLFRHVIERARGASPMPYDPIIALVGVAWYGLHPVSAETINYVYQRGDLYSTLGVGAAIAIYARKPALRRYGVYLIPALLGMLAKQAALMFAPLLFVYILLFETGEHLELRSVITAARRSIPAFVLAAAYYVFQHAMTSPTWQSGGTSRVQYWYTQPIVILHYVIQCFVPTELSADTDRQLVPHLLSEPVFIGVLALVVLGVMAARNAHDPERRPITFGIAWFVITLVPTSVLPFAEVENDHRMFMPFVGLILAIVWAVAQWLEARGAMRRMTGAVVTLGLAAYAVGTHQRNAVWHTHESLWADVAAKSPRNGRGLLNYSIALLARGKTEQAIAIAESAKQYTPTYYLLYVNLGIMYGQAGNATLAEQHFRRALELAPDRFESHSYYAMWLDHQHRIVDALPQAKRAVELNLDSLEALHTLMQVLYDANDTAQLATVARSTIGRFPGDALSQRFIDAAREHPGGASSVRIAAAEAAAVKDPSPENLLTMSMEYEIAGRHADSIKAARLALAKRPEYAAAYHNLGVAYISLQQWPEAIAAAEHALVIDPTLQPAQQNLAWAKQQLAAHPR